MDTTNNIRCCLYNSHREFLLYSIHSETFDCIHVHDTTGSYFTLSNIAEIFINGCKIFLHQLLGNETQSYIKISFINNNSAICS